MIPIELMPTENPANVMTRACQVLIASGHGQLADRLSEALLHVGVLATAAAAGADMPVDRAVSTGLWFGPHRATALRTALAPFAGAPEQRQTERCQMLVLSVAEIRGLAGFAGLTIQEMHDPHDAGDEIAITDCPKEGVLDDDGKPTHHAHVAYFVECPEEGCCPLGPELTPSVAPPEREGLDIPAFLRRSAD